MKQSTFSAVMANNLLTLLQGYSKTIRLLLVMLLTLCSSANMWGAEVTFDLTKASYNSSSQTEVVWTSTPVTMKIEKGSSSTNANNYLGGTNTNTRCYSEQVFSVSVSSGYELKTIVITSTSSSYIMPTSGWSNATATSNGSVVTVTANSGATVISVNPGGTKRLTKVEITYESSTPAVPCTVTFDACSGTCDTEYLTESSAGEGITLPEAEIDCGDVNWTFAGWAEASVTSETTDEPTLYKAGETYKPADDITLYAVYQRTEGDGESSEDVTFTFSEIASANSWTNATAYTTVTISPITITANGGGNNGKYYTSDTSWRMYNGGSVNITTSVGEITAVSSNPSKDFTITDGSASLSFSATTGFKSITVTYSSSNSTTYYHSTPECTTETVVTLAKQGGTGGTTSVTATYGQPMPAITIPTRAGYDFQGYFTANGGTGTKYYKADGTSAKNWDKTAATTLYAQWTCETPVFDIKIKDDNPVVFSGESIELTVVGSNIAADATYQWYKKNGESYDELTDQITEKLIIAEATANDAGNYKCEVTNGICSAENNYTVKMYHIKGLTDDAWTTPFEFEKSGDKEGAFSVNLAANTTYEFKLNDGSVWYWNEGTMTHNNCTDWQIEQEGDDTQGKANTKITTTASGTYIFTLNYTDPSKPKLSVTYPQKKMVYLNPGNWNCPKYAVYSWDGDGNSTVLMTKIDDCADRNIYQAEIDASHSNVIFIGGTASYNVANTWANVSYQTIDLTYPSDDNVLYEINTTHLFLVPNSNWTQSNARFAAYFFGNGDTWVSMTDANADGIYECAIPTAKSYPSVIFCRMNPSALANNWNNRWNQSEDLTITKGKNHYTISDGVWDNVGGTWKTAGDWTAFTPNYTVTFDANGHGTAPVDQCIVEGGKATQPTPAPTATGYTFEGWYTDQACNNAWDFEKDVVTEDITLYAKWTINTHTVTWIPAGGNWAGNPDNIVQTYEYGAKINAPEKPAVV